MSTTISKNCSACRARWPSSSAARACWAARCAKGWPRPARRSSSPAASEERGQARVDAIEKLGGQAVVSAGRRHAAASRSKRCWPPRWPTHGRVDMLVNCAGVNSASAYLDVTDEDWDRVLDINLTQRRTGAARFSAGTWSTPGGRRRS